jgi:hypothetical protein
MFIQLLGMDSLTSGIQQLLVKQEAAGMLLSPLGRQERLQAAGSFIGAQRLQFARLRLKTITKATRSSPAETRHLG